jgi:hypothetical protein
MRHMAALLTGRPYLVTVLLRTTRENDHVRRDMVV